MSILRGRLGAIEDSYFKREDEIVAAKLKKKFSEKGMSHGDEQSKFTAFDSTNEASVDVLPEILKHSLKLSSPVETHVFRRQGIERQLDNISSKEAASIVQSTFQPFGHVPQTRLGRNKYILEMPKATEPTPSTANELRRASPDPTKLRNLMRGLTQISKAFGIATVIVCGGGMVTAWMVIDSLGVNTIDEFPEKVKERIRPSIESQVQSLDPLKQWFKKKAEEWRMPEKDRHFIGSKLAKSLGINSTLVTVNSDDVES